VDAIRYVLGQKGLMSADKLRLGIEQMPAEDYRRLSYYERWLASIAWTMEKDGLIPPGSFAARVAELEAKR
jgi:nitrile hydratase